MASPPLLTPTTIKLKPLVPIKAKVTPSPPSHQQPLVRRQLLSLAAIATATTVSHFLAGLLPACAASDEEYVKETAEVINKVRSTINMDKNDPNIAAAVAELRETSNSWVAKYRREKALLGRASFRDIYSALNAISGHIILASDQRRRSLQRERQGFLKKWTLPRKPYLEEDKENR